MINRYERSPGPVYNTGESQDKFEHRKMPSARIGTAPRDKESTQGSLGPGPTYFFDPQKSSSHPASPRATIGRAPLRSSLIRDTPVTGEPPAAVDPDLISNRAPRAMIGKAKREQGSKEITPGPADYVAPVDKHISSKKGTFNKTERGSASWIFQ